VQRPNAVYDGKLIVIPTQGEADSLHQDGYGSKKNNSQLTLDPCEALYLVEKERLTMIDEEEKKILTFQEILDRELDKDKLLWTKYIIYRDIRGRGFVIKFSRGEARNFLVYERGTFPKKPPVYELYIVYEGMSENIGHLESELKKTKESDRSLKLAVTDRRGEVVYYSLEKLSLDSLGTDVLD
jgi:tRNA-intron endonuclease, archaea type